MPCKRMLADVRDVESVSPSSTVRRALLAFAAATTACIVYYGIVYTGQLPDHHMVSGWNDAVLHAGAFALLIVVVLPLTRRWLVPIACISAFAAAIELLQIPLPRRSASLGDFAASLAGIAVGLLVIGSMRIAKTRLYEPAIKLTIATKDRSSRKWT